MLHGCDPWKQPVPFEKKILYQDRDIPCRRMDKANAASDLLKNQLLKNFDPFCVS
jgi:hypothetical protein